MKTPLRVMLWGEEIGRLSWDERRHNSYFSYNPDFISRGLDIAPLTAPVSGRLSLMPIYGEDNPRFNKLPSFLADSLPDDWGNQLFELWRVENRLPLSHISPLEKLSFIGHRGMGALEFEPAIAQSAVADAIDIKSLDEIAKRIFAERENARILPEESLTLQALLLVGTSAGGRIPKAIIARNSETCEIRSGQIAGLVGYRYYILKFGEPARATAELEYTYYEMARKAGIRMTECELLEVEGNRHFMTERFDRVNGEKLHTQTLAALMPDASSYEQLIWVCRKLRLPEPEIQEVFRRMVFNWLANNTDDHNKNFSFVMDKSGRWNLTPAYDLTFIFNYGGYQGNLAHCLTVRGKTENVTRDDIIAFAADNSIRRPEAVIREVASALSSFRTLAESNGVPQVWIGRVEARLQDNLARWNLLQTEPATSDNDHSTSPIVPGLANIRLEETYKGNYHLLANADDRELKYVIRKNTPDHLRISLLGIANVSVEELRRLAEAHLVSKLTR